MSFSISFFARDAHIARSKLQEAHAPAAVKALIELAIAGIPDQGNISHGAGSAGTQASASEKGPGNSPTTRPPRLCGILVETHGHIDERGNRSNIGLFRVDPYYD